MRLSALILIFVFFSLSAFTQKEDKTGDVTGELIEPLFKGPKKTNEINYKKGQKNISLKEYLQDNISYPEKALRTLKEGRVVVRFNVLTTGELSDIEVVNSVSNECDNTVLKVLKSTNGMWSAGSYNGNPITMEKEISVAFMMEGNDLNKQARMYASKGKKMLDKGKNQKALNNFNKAIVYAPKHSTTLYLRGIAKYETGDLIGALADFMKVSKQGSNLARDLIPGIEEQQAKGIENKSKLKQREKQN